LCLWTSAAYSSDDKSSALIQEDTSPQDAVSAQTPDDAIAADPIHPWDGNDFQDTSAQSTPGQLRYRPKNVPPPPRKTNARHEMQKSVPTSNLPQSIGFVRNLPNPFNAQTRIEFAMERAGRATLEVYNLLGQVQDRVEWNSLEPGVHSWLWQGRSADGRPLPSGVYFYRIEVDQASAIGRMVLLK
jgi:hypothetical protein